MPQYANPKLQEVCEASKGIREKLLSIEASPGTYGTSGPSKYHKHARHAHLNNTTGICWMPVPDGNGGFSALIMALGEKNNQAKPGFSQYDWDPKGKIAAIPD